MAIPYDVSNPDPAAARQIFFEWLRADLTSTRRQLDVNGDQYERLVGWTGNADRATLSFHLLGVFWELVIEGVVAPGMGAQSPASMNLPWFHVTPYGKRVLEAGSGHPHDEAAYLARVSGLVSTPDPTVMAYLAESVKTLRRATPVAAAVMLGIAAERVFILVCNALLAALSNPAEQTAFTDKLNRYQMKPKLDWVHNKFQSIQTQRLRGWPDNATLAVTAIYDFLRTQRNDLGHPRDLPPVVDREEMFGNLQIFPRFYKTADILIQFFSANQV
jgi:hypothetical protein